MAKSYISKILPKDGYNSYEVIIVTDFAKVKKEMLNKKVWAVVGATAKQDRYGYKIWKKLKEHGYTSYAVNPSYKEIDGEKVYPSLSHIDESIDVVDMVVSPKISLNGSYPSVGGFIRVAISTAPDKLAAAANFSGYLSAHLNAP